MHLQPALTGDDKFAYRLQLQAVGDPASVTGEVRSALAEVDPMVALRYQ
jgi:hypothetical protein